MLRKKLLVLTVLVLLAPAGVLIADPVLDVSWSEEIGFPEFIDWNMGFQDLFWGGPYAVNVTIHNAGDADLIIEEITCEEQEFYAEPTNLVLEPDQSSEVFFFFNADEPGEYASVMQIIWNSPDGEMFGIPVIADAVGPPQARINRNRFVEDLMTGEIVQQQFRIENNGGAPLRFQIEHEIIGEPDRDYSPQSRIRSVESRNGPHRDDAGDIIAQFAGANVQNQYWSPVAWDEDSELMFVTSYTANQIVVYSHDNYEDFEEVRRWEMPRPMDGAWYNDALYANQHGQHSLHRWDADGNALGLLQVGFSFNGVAIDQENGLIFLREDGNGNQIRVFELNEDGAELGQQLGSFDLQQIMNGFVPNQIEWVDDHPDGQLWIGNNNDQRLHQIYVDTDEWVAVEEVQSFPAQITESWDACAHDGENIWVGGFGNANFRIYDDGVEEVRWLTYEPKSGEIEPGGNTIITVTIDATGLWGGDYEAELIIFTNDPANPLIIMSIFVNICVPFWFPIEWPEQFGFPDLIDFNGGFGEMFVGGSYSVPVTIQNMGTDPLIIESAFCDHDYFHVDWEGIELEPGDEFDSEVIFEPGEAGEFQGLISIEFNDPDFNEFEIFVHAECSLPPVMVWEPDEIEDILLEGEINEHEITISNEGDALLRWDSELELNPDEDRDLNARLVRSIDHQSGPLRDHAGELIAQFAGANVANQYWSPIGWDEDNELMFVSSYSAEQIVVYSHNNYEDFEEVRRWEMPTPMDGAWYNGALYANQHGQQFLHRWDAEGNALDQFQVGFSFFGVAIDQENGWIFFRMNVNGNDNPICVYELADDGAALGRQIGSFAFQHLINNFSPCQIEWVDDHPQGQLWISSNRDQRLYQIYVDTDDWEAVEVVQSFPAQITQPFDACCHDGEYIWVGGYANDNFRIYDDGVRELHWLTYEPEEGVIEPGGETIITVTIDTHGLFSGIYSAELIIRSNDPANPEISIGISVEVHAPHWFPFMWPDRESYADLVDFNGWCGEVHVGETYSVPILIYNYAGDDVLRVVSAECDNDWFHIDWEGIEVEIEEDVETEIIFIPEEVCDRIEGTIAVEFDGLDRVFLIQLIADVGQAFDPEHFTDFQETETSHQITITNLTMEEDRVPSGWEIGLFTPEGILSGGGVWYQRGRLDLGAFGDNPDTDDVEGFIDGDYIQIRAWDRETGREYTARPTVAEGDLSWVEGGETTLSLEVADDLFGFFIHEGWNLMSINIYPDERYYIENEDRGGPDVEYMMHAAMPDLDDHPILMKDEDGRFWASAWAMCFLPFWDLNEGYMMKFGRDVELFWHGELIPADNEITIEEGWNFIAYLPTYQLPCTAPDFYAFESIIDAVLMVKNEDGNFFVPQFEFSNLPPLKPGKGYQIKVSEELVFTYPPEPEEEFLAFSKLEHRKPVHFDRVEATGANMSVLLRGEILQADCEVGVFSTSGRLVGSSSIVDNGICGLAVWGDDSTTEELDGLSANESLELRMWNSSDNTEISLASQSGHPFYQTDDFLAINVSQRPETPREFFLSEAFPNPFNNVVKLNYQLPEATLVSIRVFDTSGRMVSTLVNGEIEAGYHVVSWEGRDVASGTYLIQMDVLGSRSTRKVTLVR